MALEEAGTNEQPFKIESLSDWNELNSYSGIAEFQNEVDCGGVAVQMMDNPNMTVRLNGYGLINVGGYLDGASTTWWLVRQGTLENGLINVNVTVTSGDLRVLRGDGIADSVRITGTLTNEGSGYVSTVGQPLNSASFTNITSELNLYGNGAVAGFFNGSAQASTTIDKCIFVGTHNDQGGGTATFYGFGNTPFNATQITNCFWDNEKQNITNDNGGATGKSTADLQTLATYTDTVNTVGLDAAYDMAAEGVYNGETWFLPSSGYPKLAFEYVPPQWNPYLVNGNPQSGIVVEYKIYDNRSKANPAILETVVSDAQGQAPLSASVPAGKHLSVQATYDDGGGNVYSDIERWITDYPK